MTKDDTDIRSLIEHILSTEPGDCFNQPEFGLGLKQYVFEPYTVESRTRLQHTVRETLNQQLKSIIEVDKVLAEFEGSALIVTIQYKVCSNKQRQCDVYALDL